ncbi:MAG: hypothetical protein HOO86_11730 [Bacteroidales bacterium]|nr:hypothetical protein [Bacteroidales bacterium]
MTRLFATLIGLILITSIRSFSQTIISGEFTNDTHLGPNGAVYIVSGDILVYGTDGPDNITTLTIDPGVTLKFAPYGHFALKIGYGSEPGQLIAQGTSSSRISFTSNSPTPTHGNWGSISLTEKSQDCVLEYVDIQYGGTDGSYKGNLEIYDPDGTNLTISNCNISYSESSGIYIDELGFDVDFNNVTVDNCLEQGIFHNNSADNAMISYLNCNISNNSEYGMMFIHEVNTQISNCNFAENGVNAVLCYPNQVGGMDDNNVFQDATFIEVEGGEIKHDSYWNNFSSSHEVNYHILDDIYVFGTDGSDSLTTLQIEAGTKLIFDPQGWHQGLSIANDSNPGQLIAIGTSSNRIVFTSTAETPAPGDWGGILFRENSQDCALDFVDILYGGNSSNAYCNLEIYGTRGSNIDISNSNIMYSEGSGIKINHEECDINLTNNNISNNLKNGSIHDWSDANTTTSYTNCEISNNGLVGLSLDSDDNIQISNCNFSNNGEHPIECSADQIRNIESNNSFQNENSIKVLAAHITKDATWHDFYTTFNVCYYIENGFGVSGFDGPDGITTLEIEPGTKITFHNSMFNVGSFYGQRPGQLIAQGTDFKRITFTSSADNPSPGDWGGIVLSSLSKDCVLDNVDIFYGGYNGDKMYGSNLTIQKGLSSNLSITNSKIAYSATDGVDIWSTPYYLLFNNNTIANNTEHGIHITSQDENMENCTQNNIYDNSGYGIMNDGNLWFDARNCYWGSNDGPGGVGPGSGDEVSEYVLYNPWLTDPLPVNISEISDPECFISIHPNPAKDYIQINSTLKNESPYLVTIYNNRSQIIYQHKVIINNYRINWSKIDNGMYFILFQDILGNKIHSQVLIIN